ncbi:hypothetical protein I316_06938 [Kwoniella heveanensis BCC8398]|uniref:RNase III domain-containing protein n=1 Tax=Kwoniella heveanensis BCC8398 TaxID=1296120 RepID=A0A1B9GK50_9TREE|nr:hypothetical protein I316_06938 [Kwoniella heveanensis BCC8398]
MTSITNGDAAPFSPLVLFEAEEFSWPPLPEITDRQFKQAVFTHLRYTTYGKADIAYFRSRANGNLDLRSKLVNRQINTHISRHYGLPEQVRTGRAQRGTFRQSDDEAGEVYEAYLAGLFFSYAKAAATQAGNQGDLLTHGQAFDKLGRFLIPLYTPLVDNLQAIHDSNPYDSLGDVEALVELSEGSKAELNLFCQKKHLEIPEYDKGEKFWPSWISQHDRVGEHGKIWKGKCTVRLTNGRIITKEGVGNGTLKSAHNVAAYLVMQDLKGMSEFFGRW